MSVWICFGVTQLRGDTILKLFGDKMLQALRLLMDVLPGIIENVMKEAFEQPMMANNLQSTLFSARRKPYAVVLLVAHEGRALPSQLLQHSRYGSRAYSEALCKRIACYPIIFNAAQLENRLQIVVDGFTVFKSGFS